MTSRTNKATMRIQLKRGSSLFVPDENLRAVRNARGANGRNNLRGHHFKLQEKPTTSVSPRRLERRERV